MPTGTALCDSVVSSFSTHFALSSITNSWTADNNSSEGILGSHPNAVCQICHAPDHTAMHYPNSYSPKPQSMLPVYATFNPVTVDE